MPQFLSAHLVPSFQLASQLQERREAEGVMKGGSVWGVLLCERSRYRLHFIRPVTAEC